jgi:hypothetical protein
MDESTCIDYTCIGSKTWTKTSTIIRANTLAMHGPSAKIADSNVNRCIPRDQCHTLKFLILGYA